MNTASVLMEEAEFDIGAADADDADDVDDAEEIGVELEVEMPSRIQQVFDLQPELAS
jgi:hypothetical protein